MHAFMIKPYMNFSPATTNIAALMCRALLKIAPPPLEACLPLQAQIWFSTPFRRPVIPKYQEGTQ